MSNTFLPYAEDADNTRLNRLEAVYAAMTERAQGFVSREAVAEVLAGLDVALAPVIRSAVDAVMAVIDPHLNQMRPRRYELMCDDINLALREALLNLPPRREGFGIMSVTHHGYGVSVTVCRPDGEPLPGLQVDIEPQAHTNHGHVVSVVEGVFGNRLEWASEDAQAETAVGTKLYPLSDELAARLMASQRSGIPLDRVGDFIQDGKPVHSLDEIVAMLAPGRSPDAEELIASTRARTEDVARMEFLAEHWQSSWGELRVSDWLASFGNLLAHGGLRGAIDHLRAQAGTKAPE